MTMMRWDPFAEITTLRQAIDQLFDNSFVRPGNGVPVAGAGMPIDLFESGDALVVKASLPGFKPEDVDVQIEQNVLSITGEHQEEHQSTEGRYHLSERRKGRVSRSITLPVAVNADECDATFEDGVLTITLPKVEHARSKHIPIRSQSPAQLGAGRAQNGAQAEPALAGRA